MNRHTLVYLFIGLTMGSSLSGCLPPPAMNMFNVPTDVTESLTPALTTTLLPTNTSLPTNTLATTNPPPTIDTSAPTDTPLPTNTLAPTSTPPPTNTLAPTNPPLPTNTLAPTSTPLPTNTPMPTSTSLPPNTPTPAPAVVGVPNTGGAEPQGEASPWILMLVAPVVGSLIILAFGLRIRARRLAQR